MTLEETKEELDNSAGVLTRSGTETTSNRMFNCSPQVNSSRNKTNYWVGA